MIYCPCYVNLCRRALCHAHEIVDVYLYDSPLLLRVMDKHEVRLNRFDGLRILDVLLVLMRSYQSITGFNHYK
jgi:hypothetical protein